MRLLFASMCVFLSVCFIHNNLCYCVRPPLCVYCFGFVGGIDVVSTWVSNVRVSLCMDCILFQLWTYSWLWMAYLSDAIWCSFPKMLLPSFCNCIYLLQFDFINPSHSVFLIRCLVLYHFSLVRNADAYTSEQEREREKDENTLASTTHKFVM